jgi:hypothetical protein
MFVTYIVLSSKQGRSTPSTFCLRCDMTVDQ